jgi:hypothetical protein
VSRFLDLGTTILVSHAALRRGCLAPLLSCDADASTSGSMRAFGRNMRSVLKGLPLIASSIETLTDLKPQLAS